MTDIDIIEAALEELNSVCEKHGIYLMGTCEMEGIYGEITIGIKGQDCGWRSPERLRSELCGYEGNSVERIGKL